MRYAIVINLDYASQAEDSCRALWDEIRSQMIAAGFRCDGRIFSIDRSAGEACALARQVIDGIESHMGYHDKRVFLFLKEFYGFDMASTTNLLLPPTDSILIDEG